jgi:hypothetical protein
MSQGQERGPPSTEVRCLEADDTIELALTAEDTLALSQAAEEGKAVAILGESAFRTTSTHLSEQYVRCGRWSSVLAASLFGMVIGVALGVVADRIPMVSIKTPPEPTRLSESQEPPVRFGNPFDTSEVFEFPPGTTIEEARQAVAAILLRRATERQGTEAEESSQATLGAAARAPIARN